MLGVAAEEWRQSIRESHPACAETEAALQRHQDEVATIRRALSNCQPALQMLLDAAATVRQAAETTNNADSKSGSVGMGHAGPSEQQLDEAYGLLKRVVPHVRWF